MAKVYDSILDLVGKTPLVETAGETDRKSRIL